MKNFFLKEQSFFLQGKTLELLMRMQKKFVKTYESKKSARGVVLRMMDEIPTIDLSPFVFQGGGRGDDDNKGETIVVLDEAKRKCADALGKCFKRHGFCYLENVGLEKEDIESVFREAKLFFEGQSTEHKEGELVQWEPKTNTGYAKYRAEVLNDLRLPDEKETFSVRKDSLYKDRDYFENVKRKKEWKEVTKRFYDKYERACESLCLATAVALGFEKDVRFFADTFREMDLCTLKILHSMPTKTTEISEKVGNKMSLRVSEHVDFGFATFLFHDSESLGRGLQVKKASRFDHGRDNLEEGWIDVAAKRGSRGNCCILNTGALLQRWTGDFYNATAHRVIVPDEIAAMQHRYSCAFFMDPDGETVIKTPEEIRDKLIERGVDVDKYPPLSCAEFLKMKINEMAVKQ